MKASDMSSALPELRLTTAEEVLTYLSKGCQLAKASVKIDSRSLDVSTAELAALIAEARGHDVSPEPDTLRFGNPWPDEPGTPWAGAEPPRIGIVVNPRRRFQVSNSDSLKGFISAAKRYGMCSEIVRRTALGSIEQFDAYLIREDTSPVGGTVYRFVHSVERSGRVSIDDFRSLIRCGNKAYQAVLFQKIGIPIPSTRLWFRHDRHIDVTALEFPVIVKTPGGAFSLEVFKCTSPYEMKSIGKRLFRRCPVLVVQAFIKSDFDWRIGICNARAIYAVKYHYPAGSWKIAVPDLAGRVTFGEAEPVALDRLPARVRDAALNAAASIGSGLYGVDVKETSDGVYVLEVNDNPDIDHKSEASIDPEGVYGTIIQTLGSRVRNSAGSSRDGGTS